MEKQIRTPNHYSFRRELVGKLDEAVDQGMINYDKACSALDAYDAGLIGDFILNQAIVQPIEVGTGQLSLVSDSQLEISDGTS